MHTQVETRGGHYVTCSTTLCCTLLTQSLSLNLEVGRPAAPSDPSVSALHSTRATGMYVQGHALLFIWVLGIWIQVLGSLQQAVNHLQAQS